MCRHSVRPRLSYLTENSCYGRRRRIGEQNQNGNVFPQRRRWLGLGLERILFLPLSSFRTLSWARFATLFQLTHFKELAN